MGMRSIPDRPALGSRVKRRSSRRKVHNRCCSWQLVAHFSIAVSKQQYESGSSSKISEKKHAPEVNKVLYRSLPLLRTFGNGSLLQPKRDKFAGLTRRAKRRKMANEEDETDRRAIGASIRSAKKAIRPTKIGAPEARPRKAKPKKVRGEPKKQKSTSSFDRDLGQRTKTEGLRAKKGDSVGRAGKRPRKSR